MYVCVMVVIVFLSRTEFIINLLKQDSHPSPDEEERKELFTVQCVSPCTGRKATKSIQKKRNRRQLCVHCQSNAICLFVGSLSYKELLIVLVIGEEMFIFPFYHLFPETIVPQILWCNIFLFVLT